MALDQHLASEADFLLITTNVCGYCVRAKRVLEARDLTYAEVDAHQDRETHMEATVQTGWRTVPVIYDLRGDEPVFVGGSDELIELLS